APGGRNTPPPRDRRWGTRGGTRGPARPGTSTRRDRGPSWRRGSWHRIGGTAARASPSRASLRSRIDAREAEIEMEANRDEDDPEPPDDAAGPVDPARLGPPSARQGQRRPDGHDPVADDRGGRRIEDHAR